MSQNEDLFKAEWNHPQNQSNSLQSIGFTCESDSRVWQYFQTWFHFSLILVDRFSFVDRTQKCKNHSSCQNVLKICVKRTHQSCDMFDANRFCYYFSLLVIDISNSISSLSDQNLYWMIKSFTQWTKSLLTDQTLYCMIQFFTKWSNSLLNDHILY